MSIKIGWRIPNEKIKKEFEEMVMEIYGTTHGTCGCELQKAMESHIKQLKQIKNNGSSQQNMGGIPDQRSHTFFPLKGVDTTPSKTGRTKSKKEQELDKLSKALYETEKSKISEKEIKKVIINQCHVTSSSAIKSRVDLLLAKKIIKQTRGSIYSKFYEIDRKKRMEYYADEIANGLIK